jgi:hypothetical protein
MPGAFSIVTIPGLDDQTDYCIWQVHRTAVGPYPVRIVEEYDCVPEKTGRGHLHETRLTLEPPFHSCDELNVIPARHLLIIRGPIIRRLGDNRIGLTIFSGTFDIEAPPPPGLTNGPRLFSGHIELYEKVGTHQPPVSAFNEPCNDHIEGWLVGRDYNPNQDPKESLNLAIAGRYGPDLDPAGSPIPGSEKLKLVLNGVIIRLH